MTDTKKVLRKLLSDHVGESNSITQAQLAEATGINTSTLRSELRRIREERNIPLANQRNGYYVIGDREELQEYIGHINSEIESKRNTIEHTVEAFSEFDTDEIEINGNEDQEPQEKTYPCEQCGRDVPRSKVKYPKGGEMDGKPLCSTHFGRLVMDGEA
jgi:transcriptional regulator with XRE-family HTH domain